MVLYIGNVILLQIWRMCKAWLFQLHSLPDFLVGSNVTVVYKTGEANYETYEDYYEGRGQRDMPLSHNYSDTGYFRIYANVSNLIR